MSPRIEKKGWVSYRMSPRIEKKEWVSYRMSPGIEHQKPQTVEIAAERSAFSTTRHFPCNFFRPTPFFSRESKLYLDISKKDLGKEAFQETRTLRKTSLDKGDFFF